jgi:hypothetical protein
MIGPGGGGSRTPHDQLLSAMGTKRRPIRVDHQFSLANINLSFFWRGDLWNSWNLLPLTPGFPTLCHTYSISRPPVGNRLFVLPLLPSPLQSWHKSRPGFSQSPTSVTGMPYVDIAQGNDFASLWYITNSPTGHVSSFDPDKPTVILLHPFFLDSTWLDTQFGDPRLNEDYNLIAFDQRAAGRTLSRPNGKQDSWTDAADLAFACHVRKMSPGFPSYPIPCPQSGVFAESVLFQKALWLPPAHIWASETTGANLAIRFAALYAPPSPPKHLCLRGLNVHAQVPAYGIKPHHAIGSVSNRVHFRHRSSGEMCVLRLIFFWFQTRGILPYM